MFFVLLLFVVVPLVELYVIVQVAQAIGILQALLLLVVMTVVGAWLVKHQGLAAWRRFNGALRRGEVPHRELADGALVLLGGGLLVLPGFVSDVLGLLLLLPPTRLFIRNVVLGRFVAVEVLDVASGHMSARKQTRSDAVWDVDSWESDPRDDRPGAPPELGR